ncbi:MAG: glycosyltransferase family 4 protein [Pseudomonadota bacterium]
MSAVNQWPTHAANPDRKNTALIVASLLSGNGKTGVEVHFNSILEAAQADGIATRLVTPYSSTYWIQKGCNFLVNQLNRWQPERAHRLLRFVHRRRLARHLRRALDDHSLHTITVYAQDPLSCAVALTLKEVIPFRLTTVAHFNISESLEFASKGITAPGDSLWASLVHTEQTALPNVDRLIFVSHYMKREICRRIPALSSTRTCVLPNFTAASEDFVRTSLSRPHRVATIGSLEPRKNQAFLIKVIDACRKEGVDVVLDIMGDGPDRSKLERLVHTLKLSDQVRFLGHVTNAAQRLPHYALLLHAADMESFGIVIIEAMAAGVPVVAHPVGGIPEIITNETNGLFWPSHDINDAATTLAELLSDTSKRTALSQAATKRFHQHFERNQMAPIWLNAITAQSLNEPTQT